jgi:hypothetical protein
MSEFSNILVYDRIHDKHVTHMRYIDELRSEIITRYHHHSAGNLDITLWRQLRQCYIDNIK